MRFNRRRRYLTTAGELRDRIESAAESVNPTAIGELDRNQIEFLSKEQSRFVTPDSVRHRPKHDNPYSYTLKDHLDIHKEKIKEGYFSYFDKKKTYKPRPLKFEPADRPTKMPRIKKVVAQPTRFRNNIGDRKKTHVRRSLRTGPVFPISDKQLYIERLIAVPYNSNEKIIGTRNDLLLNMRGVRMKMWFSLKNLAGIADAKYQQPVTIRWAVVNPKNNDGTGVPPGIGTDIFHARSPDVRPYVDFFNGTQNSFYYLSSKINRNDLGVLKEGKFELQMGTDQIRNTGRTQKLVDVWVPLRRQLEWETNDTSAAAAFPKENLYFIWWMCKTRDPTALPSLSGPNQLVDTWAEYSTYYTNASLYN
ncbi:capsid protein [Mute swan feces associated circular virus 4]|nr:capsid protein [Mute swan feces associated circular virus 4]